MAHLHSERHGGRHVLDGAHAWRARTAGGPSRVSVDEVPAATITIPNTGSFASFRTVSVPVTLAAGTHTLGPAFTGDGQNLDSIAFVPAHAEADLAPGAA